ncbi:mobilization protein [Dysgonomonas sp. 521]|uniref:conjugal transfer protein MobB n=1 Tax=Dysgonomonas sp. 521 TaxID=2302932 RepID=UPI0013D241EF|nr:conjugal transfer protein MobB [Dysgonomonas sp. 521]NDV95476.1 mobilization protein [Dysgonomonas sp. 521]
MVAKISHGSNLYGALSYNQEKVDEGLGKVLATNLVIEPADGTFNASACMQDFERFMPSHITTKKPVIHVSLNPHPDDKLTDEQLTEIGQKYMERLRYGSQPYMIFKHEDIDRQHIHIVSTRVRPDGSLVPDSFEKDRSNKIRRELEKEYNLIPANGQIQGEAWRLAPVDVSQGNLKKQVANVIKPLSGIYRFQTLGEYRALLSLYNVGVEEVKGENKGKPYRGLVYSALDGEGNRVGKPLKSSLFGKALGIEALETKFDKSKETIKTDGVTARTRIVVSEALNSTRTESEFRAALQKKGIDLVLRRNDEGRIFGATFIDHNERAVLNGSRLGKEFSANVLNERFADDSPREDLQTQQPKQFDNLRQTDKPAIDKQPQAGHSTVDDAAGSLLSVLTPETQGTDNKQPTIKRKRKKKRRYGRQL